MFKIKGTFLDSKVARRIFTLFLVSALLPVTVLAFFSIKQVNSLTADNVENELRLGAKNYGLSVNERLLLLNEKLIVHFISQSANQIEIAKNEKAVGFTQFHVFSLNDQLYLENNNIPALSSSERDFLKQGEPVILTKFQENLPAKIYLLHMIKDTNTVAMGLIDSEILWGHADTFDDSRGFCIYGNDNKLLFCSQRRLDDKLQPIKSEWQKSPTGNLTLSVSEDDKTFLVGFWSLFLKPRFFYSHFTVVITYDQNSALAPVLGLRNLFISISLLTLIIIAFLSTVQIRRYLTPLESLMSGIKRISNNDFSHPVTVDTDDEFHHLADSFNSMSTQLSQQFEFLTTMADIDQHILSNITINDILSTIIIQGNKAVQSEVVNIAMFSEHSETVIDIFSEDIHHIHGVSMTSQTIELTDKDHLVHKKTAIYKANNPNHLPAYLQTLIQPFLSSFVLVPVFVNQNFAAILIFGFNQTEFSQEVHFRLRELGDRFAIALEKAAWEKKLYQQAHYDPLTQLPNRQLLNERLQQAIKRSIRDKSYFSLLFLDLDRFKTVNDSLGHSSGDQLLEIVSQRLLNALRDDDTVARLGGDEFVVFLSPISNQNGLYSRSKTIANKILSIISEAYDIEQHKVHVSASIGIASFPTDGQDVETLIKNADSAMYHAKEEGRHNFQFYSSKLNEKALDQLTMETNLHHALENNELVMYYQPKVETMTGKILGAEALIRWNHPEDGLIPPFKFLPIAEDAGLINIIGEWTINESCRQNKAWQQQGLPAITVSVNLSPSQFNQTDLVDIVRQALKKADIDANYLDLEILEGAAMHNLNQTITVLEQLKDLGVSISIDDYGTGYSTLSYLKNFPIDNLKIDRGFIQNSVSDSGDQAIISSTIMLAHKLGLAVVAEGVEDEQQLALLQGLDCDEIQGYYFSRPVPADDFAKLLAKGTIMPSEQ